MENSYLNLPVRPGPRNWLSGQAGTALSRASWMRRDLRAKKCLIPLIGLERFWGGLQDCAAELERSRARIRRLDRALRAGRLRRCEPAVAFHAARLDGAGLLTRPSKAKEAA